MNRVFKTKWGMALRVLPVALAAVGVKFLLHRLDWEVISLSPLFSGLLGATVFLLGFLIAGVLSDYKESEKIPGEIAAGLEALGDELWLQAQSQRIPDAQPALHGLVDFAGGIIDWLEGRLSLDDLHGRLNGLTAFYPRLEGSGTPPQFLGRMRQEQGGLRRLLIRVQVIRETSFVGSAYAIAQLMAGLVVAGFLLARIEPMREAHFFVGVITFLLVYMIRLIRDLDDPFEYDGGSGGPDEVALFPIAQARDRLRRRLETLAP
jgi:hypothetical protein